MHTGMLWFDNDPRTSLAVKIQKAAEYYRQKYGRQPDLCLVNPTMLQNEKISEEHITVRPYRPILPGHLWIGIEDQN
ncbi:MAG: hypothetical protein ACP5QU_08950 [Anaerolineae bacterium]